MSDETVETEVEPDSTPKYKKVTTRLLNEVLRGDWGVGQARRLALSKAGYDHREVHQAMVDRRNK